MAKGCPALLSLEPRTWPVSSYPGDSRGDDLLGVPEGPQELQKGYRGWRKGSRPAWERPCRAVPRAAAEGTGRPGAGESTG